MSAVFLQLRDRFGHGVPMAGKQDRRVERDESRQRAKVGRHVAFRVRDHRAAAPEHQVAREQRAVGGQPERQVVGAVARRMQRGDVQVARPHDVAVGELGKPAHRGAVLRRDALRQGQVIGMRVRHQHDRDGRSLQSAVDGREMRVVLRAGVDDDGHRTGIDQPRVGARPRVGTWIRRDDAPDDGHRVSGLRKPGGTRPRTRRSPRPASR